MATREELLAQKKEIEAKLFALEEEEKRLEAEKVAAAGGLTEENVLELRRAITIVGSAVASSDVIFADVSLEDADPEITEGGYRGNQQYPWSIHMEVSFVNDYGMGLKYAVTIKTRHPGIRAIVMSMLTSNEYIPDLEEGEAVSHWSADWDYHYAISVKNPLSEKDYWTALKAKTNRRGR